jgi:hypothetical protein
MPLKFEVGGQVRFHMLRTALPAEAQAKEGRPWTKVSSVS